MSNSSGSTLWGVPTAWSSGSSNNGAAYEELEVDMSDTEVQNTWQAEGIKRRQQGLRAQMQGRYERLQKIQELKENIRLQKEGAQARRLGGQPTVAQVVQNLPMQDGVPDAMCHLQLGHSVPSQLSGYSAASSSFAAASSSFSQPQQTSASSQDVEAKKTLPIQPPTPDKPFYNSEGVDLMKVSDEELERYVPKGPDGERTSIGALNHPNNCTRCIFWFRNVCEKGMRCEFCHIKHPGQVAKKIRPSKSFRLKQNAGGGLRAGAGAGT